MVLLSPDGPLTQLPFAALPGKDLDKYLIEEVALAVIPFPQMLPELLAAVHKPAARESLLLVGGVDFDANLAETAAKDSSRTAPRERAGEPLHWSALPGTEAEARAIQTAFRQRAGSGSVTSLSKSAATKSALRDAAPGHRWLHLATHGFFAPPEVKSALDTRRDPWDQSRAEVHGFHPGLLSGLVLAGANHRPEPGQEDGILTTLEVAELDLRGVELAVLSACQTGLGKETRGEGVLGLQSGFQVAGAGTVAASLWSVDDEATRFLMERFYDNLWRQKDPLSKIEALREAQKQLLREGIKRGLVRGMEREPNDDPKVPGRTSPYYWAAFSLSGDWR